MEVNNASSFIKKFCRTAPYLIATIPEKGGLVGKGFTSDEGLQAYIDKHVEKSNIYFSTNSLREIPSSGKASKKIIKTMDYLHVDIDDKPKEECIAELRAFDTPPTCIIDSGGGIQAFWKLREPQAVNEYNVADLESYNRQISIMFGGDKCHNIDRIMRVPFTNNIPNAKKLKDGRVKVPTKLIEFNDNEYELSQFLKATVTAQANKVHDVELSSNLPEVEVHELGLGTKWMQVILNGNCDENPYPSRSEALMAIICSLLKAGNSDDIVASICLNKDNAISDSIYEKARPMEYLEQQISKAKEFNVDPQLQKLNADYCVVCESGKTWIFHEHFDHEMNRDTITRMDFTNFKNYYCNQYVEVADKQVSLGTWWVGHPQRRSYKGVVFSPLREVEGMYNLWRGFAVEPRPSDWGMMRDHIKNVICSKNDEHFEYTMNWMARCVQYPHLQGEVAVIIRGDKGTGKGTFVNGFGKLFGTHYLQITNNSHLVGKFNAHMEGVCLMFSDEGFWAGDKQGESVLKGIITEDQMMVERKGVDSQAKNNHISLIVASNSEWVVPATEGERRYFVLDTSKEHMQDMKYFERLKKQMSKGGNEGMLYDLLKRDISKFNIRVFPQTEALNEQKILSMDHNHKWWFDKLNNGLLLDTQTEFTDEVKFSDILNDYCEATSKRGINRKSGQTELSKFLSQMSPEKIKSTRKTEGNERVRLYRLPSLDSCRKHFDEFMGTKTDWDNIEELDEIHI